MAYPVCYIVDKKIDGYIASKFGWDPSMQNKGMNPAKIASLRGLYDQQAAENGTEQLLPDNPTQEDLDKAFENLLRFREGMKRAHAAKMAKGVKHIDRAYDILRHAFSLHQRKSRVSLLSNLFSAEVDRHVIEKGVDRQMFVTGFTTIYGEKIGGEFSILEGVYNQILELRARAYAAMMHPEDTYERLKNEKDENGQPVDNFNWVGAPTSASEYAEMSRHRYEEFTKILENWDALVPFVLKDLVKKEGVKLGVKKEYAATASSDSFGDNDISAKWDISEAVRDGWQRNNDLESAFGSVGQQVRRILSTVPQVEAIPQYETGISSDGTQYRKFVGMKYVPVVDDLGNQQFMDATKTHQELMEFLKGAQNSEDMLAKFCKKGNPGEAKIAWMQPIVDILTSNPQARTQFFRDFKKNFQPYSIMWEDENESWGAVRIIKTRLLNRAKNYLLGKYNMAISPRGKLPINQKVWGYTPIFDEGTKEVDWKRIAELRKKVLDWTVETRKGIAGQTLYGVGTAPLIDRGRNATITIDGKTQALTHDLRREFLMEVFSSLGFDVTVDAIDSIIMSNDIYKVREELENLFDPDGKSGFLYAAGVKSLGDKNIQNLQEKHMKMKPLFNKFADKERTNQPVKIHTTRLLDIISKHQEGYRVESRVRYDGNTMYSFVNPSFLGDRLEAIQAYVNEDNKIGLLQFLRNEYLDSPFFVDDEYLATNGQTGRILNSWLADLVRACKNKNTPLTDSVAAIFNYERDLGKNDKKFENFTIKEHGIDMFIHFFADEQQKKGYEGKGGIVGTPKKLSAMYPIFILGDAGVSKYIRAPRISSPVRIDKNGNILDEADANKTVKIEYRFDKEAQDRVVDAFYDVYIQERRRMEIDNAISLQMYANGKSVKHVSGQFSFLTFLNEDSQEYNEKYNISGHEEDADFIKGVIRQYLEDASLNGLEHDENGRIVKTPSFKQRLQNLGVLDAVDTKNGKVYKNISTIANENNIDDKIREFFWNTKLATVQQLQLMTIDPSFYHGTKDLQKRYKEIHAPGIVLDIKARNMWATDGTYPLFSEDGIERVAYFDDIKINAENTNPEFMEAIVRMFALPGTNNGGALDDAIKMGLCIPQIDPEQEKKRQEHLKAVLGENYKIYESYCKNTLTDGQGYRTLTSYRKVMGMAGQWSKQMEDAYEAIMEIRKKHADGSDVTSEELKQIAQFALVLQPIKPYMFTHEKYPIKIAKKDKNGNTVMGTDGKPVMIDTFKQIPVQHKYAEALIIPELMPKGSKLRDLGLWMDNHNIDMVGSTKIAKVGCFGQASLENANDINSLEEAMSKAYIHELPYRDYRIQTNVPEHINASQLFGTQVRKLIMAGLNMGIGDYYKSYLEGVSGFKGTVNLSTDGNKTNSECSLDGRNLLALYNSLICANIFDSYDNFAGNSSDIELLSDLLQQSTVGSTREAMDNLFSYIVTGNDKDLQKFLIPLYEGGLEHDTAALILSTFKKIVNKQQISGGSAVQVSAFGIDRYKKDGGLRFVSDPDNPSNILYAEIEMPFDKSYVVDVKNADGSTSKQKVNIPYEKYCLPDGNLIPAEKVIEKGTADWKKYQSYTYKRVNGELVPCDYNDPQAEVHKPLIEEDYPDILSILAYRIPTERDYSMINCRVKRFSPKTAGGTLKVPPQGTTIAGFDFDIDKLYFMQREYHKHYRDGSYIESAFSDSDKNEVWAAFYEDNPEIKEALENARASAELADPSLVEYVPIIRNGVDTGRTRVKHKTHLNQYWDAANIEEKFGRNKTQSFAETAQKEGIKPTDRVVNGEPVEWMEEYNFDKAPEENTRAARNNLLITLIQARLSDPQTARQRYTPGGFANASNAARFMRELFHGELDGLVDSQGNVDNDELNRRQNNEDSDPEPDYDPTDPYTILIYNQQNQVAGKLIGIFANQNTNHAFASAMDVFRLTEPIEFCGHSFKDFLHKDDKGEADRIDLNMAEFLAASVDAVKDPVLNFLNLNTQTADAGAVLARIGYNTREIGLLFNQPIVRKICDVALNKGVRATSVIDDIRKDLEDKLVSSGKTKSDISERELVLGIINERKVIENGGNQEDFLQENAETQLAVLELFNHILKVSQDVSDFVLSTKFTASNAVSSTFGGMYAQQLKVDEYLNKFPKGEKDKGSLSYEMVVAVGAQDAGLMSTPIDNDKELLTMSKQEYLHKIRFNPFAYEQAMYDANRKAIKLLAKYFPYERPVYKQARERINSLARYGNLSEDEINDIHSEIPVALLAKQKGSLFDGEAVHKKDGEEMNLTNREYYRERFAKDLFEMIAADPDGLGSLALFKYIFPIQEDVEGEIDPNTGIPSTKETWRISIQDIGGMDADLKEEIRESWAYLMEVKEDGIFEKEEYANLGRDLFMYCFYQLGFDFSPLSFMHLAPTAVKDNIVVGRNGRLAPKAFSGKIGVSSDDVLVWSASEFGSAENASANFDANISVVGELSGNAFQLPEKLTVNDVRALIKEAISHPELNFKIDKELTQEEFDLFTTDNIFEGVPSNIYFSQGTLNKVSQDSKDKVAYGVNRTYRQFLNEVLDGTEAGLDKEEFAQMWILNHLDDSRFVLDTNIDSKGVKNIIDKATSIGTSKIIDLSSFQNDRDREAVSSIADITERDGKIVNVEWVPVIKINDSYYMAKSNTDLGFNTNNSLTMTYVKVEPWGCSKAFKYDGNKELSPSMRYQSSMNAVPLRNTNYKESTTPENNPVNNNGVPESPVEPQKHSNGNVDTFRKQMEETIFSEYVAAKAYSGHPLDKEEMQNLREGLSQESDQNLKDTIEAIKTACRENNILILDEKGNLMQGC